MNDKIGAVKYWFSRLPKWVRATFWAAAMTAAIGLACGVVVLFIHFFWTTFGVAAFFISLMLGIIFVIVVISIWNELPDDKEKRKRDEP